MTPYDGRLCMLGEGPLWHPERQQLFWFDILGQQLLSRQGDTALSWPFEVSVSAAGWVDGDSLLLASDHALLRFDIPSSRHSAIVALEADRPETRSNDGRADPMGGFWIGTMGRRAEPGLGAIYRYHRGTLRKLYGQITIPNSIAFAPDGRRASFSDTARGVIQSQALDPQGWPLGPAEDWIDLRTTGEAPDGAVFDAEGCLWVALWGASRLARFAPDGQRLDEIALPVPQPSCPAFGGPDLDRLFVTSAREGMDAAALEAAPLSGALFEAAAGLPGRPEHRVIL